MAASYSAICQESPATPVPQPEDPASPLKPLKTSVTVTGTRTATELDRTPISTSLVTREEIETRNLYLVDQALNVLEGVNAPRAKGPADSDFGIGLRGFAGNGGQMRTLVLLDGQPLNDSYYGSVNWALLPIGEFERVEVARGPFSSLYGGNAMGGVINLITRPAERRHIQLFGQYGSYDTANYSIHATDRFWDKLGVGFGYQRYQDGGYMNRPLLKSATSSTDPATPVSNVLAVPTTYGGAAYQVGQRGREWFNQHAYRGRGEYTFSQRTFASFQAIVANRTAGYDAYRSDIRNASGQPVDSGLVSFTDPAGVTRRLLVTPSEFIGIPTGSSTQYYQGQVLTDLNSQWNVRVLGGVNRTPNQWYVQPGALATLTSGDATYNVQESRAIYGNIQAGWKPRSQHEFIFGTETRHNQGLNRVLNLANYTQRVEGGSVQRLARGQSVNQAVYAQDQIALTERFHVVVGGRYDYWRAYDGVNQRTATLPLASYPDHAVSAFTGKLAASYQAPAGFQLRGSVGNAFRNPTIYELYQDLAFGATLYLANPNAKPERLLSYEVGVQRHFGGWASFDVAFYENRIHDLLYRTTDLGADPTGRTIRLTNAGLGRTRGVEIALQQQPLRWLQLKQTYTYADAIITENPSLPYIVGRRIPFVPDQMTSFVALLSRGRWSGSASGRYQSAIYSSDGNEDALKGVPQGYDPFFTMDMSAGFQLTRHIGLTANVYNLLDRRYYLFYLAPGRQAFGGIRIRL